MIKNKLATHKNQASKEIDFLRDTKNGAVAYRDDLTSVPLSQLIMNAVEFIGGRWRIQKRFPYKIQMIRDLEMVLLNQLPHQDHVLFDYYTACVVGWNCYGPFISGRPEYIVAKYTTDDGVYWGYGRTIEEARAFLGIKLYDEYMDLIHEHACKNQIMRQKK